MLRATPVVRGSQRGGDATGDFVLFGRHERQAVRMAVAAAAHHSYDRSNAHACTQTDFENVAPASDVTDTEREYERQDQDKMKRDRDEKR